MPRVKKQAKLDTSLRAPKGRDNLPRKIASSSTTKVGTPRNDRKRLARGSLSVPVYSLAGRSSGTMILPKEIFGTEVNKKLLAQALRVYMTNQKTFTANTKTRGEVRGSTAKIFRQKGTGRARHGAIRAPIFVGGGIVFGPKPRKVRLDLSKKMKRSALLSALSSKLIDKAIVGLTGLEKASGKTKEIAQLVNKISKKEKKLNSALIVMENKTDNAVRAVRNIPGIDVLPANMINAYEVLRHEILMLTKDAIEKLTKVEKGQK